MIEENKYFTPEISDIRVGYECEIRDRSGSATLNREIGKYDIEKWNPYIVEVVPEAGGDVIYLSEELRVPYLTKEQIEAEGWEYSINYEANDYIQAELGFLKELEDGLTQFMAYYNPINQELRVEMIYDCGGLGWVYKGKCKDINTFRMICKLLKI